MSPPDLQIKKKIIGLITFIYNISIKNNNDAIKHTTESPSGGHSLWPHNLSSLHITLLLHTNFF